MFIFSCSNRQEFCLFKHLSYSPFYPCIWIVVSLISVPLIDISAMWILILNRYLILTCFWIYNFVFYSFKRVFPNQISSSWGSSPSRAAGKYASPLLQQCWVPRSVQTGRLLTKKESWNKPVPQKTGLRTCPVARPGRFELRFCLVLCNSFALSSLFKPPSDHHFLDRWHSKDGHTPTSLHYRVGRGRWPAAFPLDPGGLEPEPRFPGNSSPGLDACMSSEGSRLKFPATAEMCSRNPSLLGAQRKKPTGPRA